ncbi:hypothetical protein L596_016872 [Steinernema carpocapsae]|uniref:Uncharacterized protein n=1 Tax=Steinernema carpocapsae TaxID=34508 RepID=A0A4U5NKL7_STECR|nr:hypothetical protein L596_016872 [Steinernema carpocapsae]
MTTRDRTAEFRRAGSARQSGRSVRSIPNTKISVASTNPFEGNFLAVPVETTSRGHKASASIHSTDVLLNEIDQLHVMMDQLDIQIQKLKAKQNQILEEVLVEPKRKVSLHSNLKSLQLT